MTKPFFTKKEYLPDVVLLKMIVKKDKNKICYLKNKDKYIIRAKLWAKNNPEKRRLIVKKNNKKSKLSKRFWHEKKYFGGNATIIGKSCYLCYKKTDLIIHHKDGCNGRMGKPTNNHPDNLLILCRACHPKVHNRHWIKEVV